MMRLENVLSVESIRRNPASDGQAAIAGVSHIHYRVLKRVSDWRVI